MIDNDKSLISSADKEEWSDDELRACIQAYLEMLDLQRLGKPFKKSEYNAKLRDGVLAKRTKSAVEFRMQNISAVLEAEGEKWLEGYRPAKNIGANVGARVSKLMAEERPQSRPRRREHLLDAIRVEHIRSALKMLQSGHSHNFGDSTKFDVLFEGRTYPPKAVIGLAAEVCHGESLNPGDFTAGIDSKSFRILTREGFQIVPKTIEFRPTADWDVLQTKTTEALNSPYIPKPAGQISPQKISREVAFYERDPLIRAYVLRRAGGKCECCGGEAPFMTLDGQPFLEVHHVATLANGGSDTTENTAALCPNCHRECHHGVNAALLGRRLVEKISGFGISK